MAVSVGVEVYVAESVMWKGTADGGKVRPVAIRDSTVTSAGKDTFPHA